MKVFNSIFKMPRNFKIYPIKSAGCIRKNKKKILICFCYTGVKLIKDGKKPVCCITTMTKLMQERLLEKILQKNVSVRLRLAKLGKSKQQHFFLTDTEVSLENCLHQKCRNAATKIFFIKIDCSRAQSFLKEGPKKFEGFHKLLCSKSVKYFR